GALANELKEQRIALCTQYNACKVPPAEHAARDRTLSDLMSALIKLWDSRQLGQPDGVAKFHDGVVALARKLGGPALPGRSGPPAPPAAPGPPPPRVVGVDRLAKLESSALSFKSADGAVTVASEDESASAHDALRGSGDALGLAPQHRYQIRVLGAYTPASP